MRVLVLYRAHFPLQISDQVAVISFGAEAGNQDHLNHLRSQLESIDLCFSIKDLGRGIDPSILVDDGLHDIDQILKSLVFEEVYKPARFELA